MATVKSAPKSQKSAAPTAPPARNVLAELTAQLLASRPKVFKVPKKLAECADVLYTMRNDRLKLNKVVEAIETDEKAIKAYVVENLPKSNATGIAGTVANISVEAKTIVMVEDFDKLMKYIVKEYPKNPGVAALLMRSVNVKAAEEMWAAKKVIPGVKRGTVPSISCTKVG